MNTCRRCYGCGLFGHYRRECPTNPYVHHSRRQKVKPAERHKAKQAEYCENTTSTSNDEYDEKSNKGICQNQELSLGIKVHSFSQRAETHYKCTALIFKQSKGLGYLNVSQNPGGRGRERKSAWNVAAFLLRRSNVDFVPSNEESTYLSQNGLGWY